MTSVTYIFLHIGLPGSIRIAKYKQFYSVQTQAAFNSFPFDTISLINDSQLLLYIAVCMCLVFKYATNHVIGFVLA